jgi:hypothetical protein
VRPKQSCGRDWGCKRILRHGRFLETGVCGGDSSARAAPQPNRQQADQQYRTSLACRRPLVDLDIGSPRIGDERNSNADFIDRIRPVELDALGFLRLDETLEVLHVEADVIEDAALGRGLRAIRLVEAQLDARDVGDGCIVARARLGSENFSVPCLAL